MARAPGYPHPSNNNRNLIVVDAEDYYGPQQTRQPNRTTADIVGDPKTRYDPYEHRKPKRPISSLDAFILLIKGATGSGILSAGIIFADGWATGIVYTCLISALVTYCLHVLLRTNYQLCKKHRVPYLSYSATVKKVLEHGPSVLRPIHRYSIFCVESAILAGQFAICTTYALFILQTFGFYEVYVSFLHIGLGRWAYCLLLAIPFVFIVFMGNWLIATLFSLAANVLSIIPFGILFFYLVQDLKPLGELTAVGDVLQLPRFFGPILYSLEAVSVVTAFEVNLVKPKKFTDFFGILNGGMLVVTVLYILVGFLGYWKYEKVLGSFLNDIPITDVAAIISRSIYTLVIYISYGLHGFVMVNILWQKKQRGYKIEAKHIFRICFVLLTTLVITAVPFIIRTVILDALFAISLPILGIVLPAFVEFCFVWNIHNDQRNLTLFKDAVIITIGLVDTFAGLYFCGGQLIQFFNSKRNVLFW